ncbi:FliH/SctL family protein [Sphingomonas immobilis]|uniref:FliH/SctL family protein n=1 Tax=Sphingomonas immobilis TaxID=3063997 RepID=A0ABT8ZV79_9SPHN|nr:FliH/SctL family protein [Sphingomonas sp. CA1-15]MDO7841485.1 FliH/SctL family protein [Sphingomonas sp. CA1-15]
MSDMSGFTSGLAARHDALAQALQRAFSVPQGFAPTDIRDSFVHGAMTGTGPTGFAKSEGPKHFSPADPGANPTEGWDPFELDAAANAAAAAASDFIDPVEAAHTAGFDEGYAAGLAEARAGADRDRALIEGIVAALGSEGRLNREQIAQRLRQTVLYLVAQLVGEVGVAPDRLAKRIATATDMLSDASESAMLHVHPDDVALLEGKLPKTIFAVGDATIARGSFLLESASTIVEDGPDLWLEQLSQAIERVAMPHSDA